VAGHQFYAEWSEADGEFVGRVNEYPSLSWLDPNVIVALQGIRDLVAEVEADMEAESIIAIARGYSQLSGDWETNVRDEVRRERGLAAAQSVYRAQQEQIKQALQSEDPPDAQDWAGVHGAQSKRFTRQDYWVFIGIAVVIAWILLGPVF